MRPVEVPLPRGPLSTVVVPVSARGAAPVDDLPRRLEDALTAALRSGEGSAVVWGEPGPSGTGRGTYRLAVDAAAPDAPVAAFVEALRAEGVEGVRVERRPRSDLATPLLARWRTFVVGPSAPIPARLRVVEGLDAVHVPPVPRVSCPTCGADARPVERWYGYPDWDVVAFHEALDELPDLMGCILPDAWAAPTRCGACGVRMVPSSWYGDDAATALVWGDLEPVPRCPRTFRSGDGLVWAPRARRRGGTWTFTLHPGVRRRLLEAGGWLALRPDGSAMRFVAVDALPAGHPDLRLPIRVRADDATHVRIGRRRVRSLLWLGGSA